MDAQQFGWEESYTELSAGLKYDCGAKQVYSAPHNLKSVMP
jgi:hypothetical protein